MLTAVENNDTKWEYTYDVRGNILTKKEYAVTVADDGTKTYTLKENGASTFGYDTVWADKLTSFNGQTITYDEVGNPLTYRGNTLTWNFGRRLASFGNISYTYNEDGIRTKKMTEDSTTEFYLDGSNIIRQSDGTDTLYFFYDRDDNLTGFEYDGDVYFYVKNMQGDIVAISDDSGNVVAEYTYDPWGKVLSVTGTNSALGNLNPFRYRGYYYDTDTNLYYLQSRYYDPETGRFLNSDDVNFIGTTESEISYNPFAYCENDPVNAIDPTGRSWYSMVTNVFSLICTFAFLGSRLSWKARVVISMILGAAGFLSTIIDYRKQLNQIKGKRNYSRNLKEANLWLWLGIIASCITVISGILYIPKFALSKSVGVAVINAIGFARGMGLTNALLANDLAAALNRTPRPKFRF